MPWQNVAILQKHLETLVSSGDNAAYCGAGLKMSEPDL